MEFSIVKNKTKKVKKINLNCRIIEDAYNELKELAEENDIYLHTVATQLIYYAMGRNQLTGEKK